MASFYTQEELETLGLKHVGEHVLISRKASIYDAAGISIGNHVRIDDFCLLSGKIKIGNYVHISAYASLFAGKTGILVGDFASISSRCAIYAESDDYSGAAMTNPMVPDTFRNVQCGVVSIGRHVIIGSGSTVLPGAHLAEGAAVGSMTLVNKPLSPWRIYVGVPCRELRKREQNILLLEKEFLKQQTNQP